MSIAKNIMTPQTESLSFDTPVLDAVAYLKEHRCSFVPVAASSDRWQGILTEAVMVRIFLKFQSNPEKDLLIFYRDYFEPIQLIHETEIFADVVKKVMTSIGNRVFVIDDQSHVIGCITARDVLPYFVEHKGAGRQDTDPLVTINDQLRSDLYLYESFFSKCPFLMHSVNKNGEIQMANHTLHALLGYEYGELIGKTIFDLYPKENHEKARAGLQAIFSEKAYQFVQTKMVSKDGSHVGVEMVSRPLEDQNKKALGTITVSRPLEMERLLKALPET